MSTKKIQIIDSLVKQAENADTLDGKHADEFAAASDVETLKTKVGDSTVSEQINAAVTNKVDKVTGTQGNIVTFGADGAIADSGKKATMTYVVPYYSPSQMVGSITEAQQTEIVNIVNKIKADTGDYAVFIKASGTLIPAQYSYNSRTGVNIFAVEHATDYATQYTIQVKNNGTVTMSVDSFFASEVSTATNYKAPTVNTMVTYIEEQKTKVFEFVHDNTNNSDDANRSVYNEFVAYNNAHGFDNIEVKMSTSVGVLATSFAYSADTKELIMHAFWNGLTYVVHITETSIGYNTNSNIISILTTFNETNNTQVASQKATADWVKSYVQQYVEDAITNGAW